MTHYNIHGNERAYELAKAGENFQKPHPPQSLNEGKTTKTIYANVLVKRKWQL